MSALRRASQAWERMEGELAEKTLSGVWGWWCLVGLGCWCSSQPALEGRTTVAPSSSIPIMAPTQFPLPGFAQASQPTSRLPHLCCVHHGRPLCHLPFWAHLPLSLPGVPTSTLAPHPLTGYSFLEEQKDWLPTPSNPPGGNRHENTSQHFPVLRTSQGFEEPCA